MNPLPGDASQYINRETSWLEFNRRVLAEAFDPGVPLLERLKFLAIFGTNLDEFYMVRVAGLRRQAAGRYTTVSPDGLTPREALEEIERRVREMLSQAQRLLYEDLLPALDARGVKFARVSDIGAEERKALDAFFESQVFPVLTPLAVDPGHPFPYISNLSLSLAVQLRDPERGTERFARVKVPRSLPRWVPVAGRPHTFVPLEDLIGEQLAALFPGMQVLGWHTFRITRYSDLEIADTEESEDYLAMIEEQVFQRRFGEVVRLEVQPGMPAPVRALLLDELRETEAGESLELTDADVHEHGPLLELGDLMALASLDIPELRDAPFTPNVPMELREADRSIFDVIREHDVMVHHPYDSFAASVEQFIEAASRDEQVLAIKMTLYRTSGDGAIVRALTEAAQRGIQVAVLVELQARFEEVNNITWARTLESFGVHVAYGLPGLKTHAKVALVVRREADGIRRYVQLGTGNYNGKTARLYTDIGLFTAADPIGADVSDLFNSLTGFSRQRAFRRLIVAPSGMRERVCQLIDREAENARAGRPARIVAKMNALVDTETIQALYAASQAGVAIDLIIRGICCLRPGVPGLSDTIRVISIVGRFLEHSRTWCFAAGGAHEHYLSSADWMPRNFSRRVEVAVPVDDPVLRQRLSALLDACVADDCQAWELRRDGSYVRRTPDPDAPQSSQIAFLRHSWGLGEQPPRPDRPADVFG
jgi:polyphosphate kinase